MAQLHQQYNPREYDVSAEVEKKTSKQSSAEHNGERAEMQGTRTLSEWAAPEAARIVSL